MKTCNSQRPSRPKHHGWFTGLLLLCVAGAVHPATPNNALGIMLGKGTLYSRLDERTYVGFSLRQAWEPQWSARLPRDTQLSLAYSLGHFHGCGHGVCDYLTDVGVGPTLRYIPAPKPVASWYLDFGIGVHFISQTHINNEAFSTALQFNELLGFGVIFGTNQRYDLGLSYVHESNGDLKTPNDGMNFILLNFAIRW